MCQQTRNLVQKFEQLFKDVPARIPSQYHAIYKIATYVDHLINNLPSLKTMQMAMKTCFMTRWKDTIQVQCSCLLCKPFVVVDSMVHLKRLSNITLASTHGSASR